MIKITDYIKDYFVWVNKIVLLLVTALAALLIYLNYHYGLEKWMTTKLCYPLPHFTGHYILFFVAFALPYFFVAVFNKQNHFLQPKFILLLLLAPAIFAVKMALNIHFNVSTHVYANEYWNYVLYWPFRLLIIVTILFLTWKFVQPTQSFYGLTTRQFNWKPYAAMLLIMIPLIAAASTQPDFLAMYPKMKMILPIPGDANHKWFYKLLFELAYGSDFISIELFFRGFLILAFVKYAGKDAILPMACFYCTIHFGKPLGECISSYFGGLLLGIIIYNNHTILGGLMVHLGIAWLMELGGYIGNTHFH
jgi:hypothetical protein